MGRQTSKNNAQIQEFRRGAAVRLGWCGQGCSLKTYQKVSLMHKEGRCWQSDQLPHFADGAMEALTSYLICPQPPTGLSRLLRPNGIQIPSPSVSYG
ncbi:hypothetical protein CB1_000661039 [Camelus ferus]|nr:hypothetical protein CB1_000661039 [Camelus ferus]